MKILCLKGLIVIIVAKYFQTRSLKMTALRISRRSLRLTFTSFRLMTSTKGLAPIPQLDWLRHRWRPARRSMAWTAWPHHQPPQNGSSSWRTSLEVLQCCSGLVLSSASWPTSSRPQQWSSPRMTTCIWASSWPPLLLSLESSLTTRSRSPPRSWSPSRTWFLRYLLIISKAYLYFCSYPFLWICPITNGALPKKWTLVDWSNEEKKEKVLRMRRRRYGLKKLVSLAYLTCDSYSDLS